MVTSASRVCVFRTGCHKESTGVSYLHSVGDGEAGVGGWDLSMHEDHHQGGDADQSHTDDVQAHSQPPHGTAEQVERSLVLVQQQLVPENKTYRLGEVSAPGSHLL